MLTNFLWAQRLRECHEYFRFRSEQHLFLRSFSSYEEKNEVFHSFITSIACLSNLNIVAKQSKLIEKPQIILRSKDISKKTSKYFAVLLFQ